MGADSPDSAGKVYYRLTLEHVNSWLMFGFDIAFGGALQNAYTALQASTMVIPVSATPRDDGSDVAVVDVVVSPQGMLGASVGDLVMMLDQVSSIVAVKSIERINLGGVDSTTQAQQRQQVADSAAKEVAANSITSSVTSFLGGWSTNLKFIVAGLLIIVVGYIYFTRRRS
jgi:hypothetical protein